MFTNRSSPGDHRPPKSLQIKQDDKLFSRFLSKENSATNPSFRVYYGGVSGAIPFMWESQPGTPKHPLCDSSLPPLTPPPSYYSSHRNINKPAKQHPRSKLLHALFPKINHQKHHHGLVPPSPSSLSSLSSLLSSRSWISVPRTSSIASKSCHRRSRTSCGSSSFDEDEEEEEKVSVGSPTSTLCFGIGARDHHTRGTAGRVRGGAYVKKALFTIVGRRSGAAVLPKTKVV